MAFIFLNRYIDLADAIDDHTNEIVENQYLAETDIPYEINLPDTKYLSVSVFRLRIVLHIIYGKSILHKKNCLSNFFEID